MAFQLNAPTHLPCLLTQDETDVCHFGLVTVASEGGVEVSLRLLGFPSLYLALVVSSCGVPHQKSNLGLLGF